MDLNKITATLLMLSLVVGCEQGPKDGVVIIIPETGRDIVIAGDVDNPDTPDEPEDSIPFIGNGNNSNPAGSDDEATCSGTEQRPCDGQCGLQTCQLGAWSDCQNGLERCNGHDDDCDGTADESLGVGMTCSNRQDDGCTGSGQLVCDAETQTVVCNAPMVAPVAESCDGSDNDCDGIPDEDFPNQRCCTEDYQCPPSASCVDGLCTGGNQSGGGSGPGFGSDGGACQTLLDCALGQTCASGQCVPMCFTHADCQAGQHCGCPPEDPGCLLMACLEGTPAGGQDAPDGVSCDEVTVVAGQGQYQGTTMNAASDLAAGCGNQGRGPEKVFSVRFDVAQNVVFDTVGSDFDTVLAVRTQCNEMATEIACDDDGAGQTRSRLRVRVQAGQDYFVVVHGYDQNSRGNIILNIAAANGGGANGNRNAGNGLCDDTCGFANDGACDDGGPGSSFSVCALGTDCGDCGPR